MAAAGAVSGKEAANTQRVVAVGSLQLMLLEAGCIRYLWQSSSVLICLVTRVAIYYVRACVRACWLCFALRRNSHWALQGFEQCLQVGEGIRSILALAAEDMVKGAMSGSCSKHEIAFVKFIVSVLLCRWLMSGVGWVWSVQGLCAFLPAHDGCCSPVDVCGLEM